MLPARSKQTPTSAPSSQTPSRRRGSDPLEAERYNVEILRGVYLMSPRPAAPHARAAGNLHFVLSSVFDRPGRGGGSGPGGLWWILFEPELPIANGDLLIPDLAAWRREKLPALPRSGPLRVMPDWVCEVLSPSTERNDRQVKLSLYHAAGVEHVWLLDPLDQRLERYVRGSSAYDAPCIDAGDVVIHAPPFEQGPLDLAEIWPIVT